MHTGDLFAGPASSLMQHHVIDARANHAIHVAAGPPQRICGQLLATRRSVSFLAVLRSACVIPHYQLPSCMVSSRHFYMHRWCKSQGCAAHCAHGQRCIGIRALDLAAWLHHCGGTSLKSALCNGPWICLEDASHIVLSHIISGQAFYALLCQSRCSVSANWTKSTGAIFGVMCEVCAQVRMSPDNMTAFVLWDAHDDHYHSASREISQRCACTAIHPALSTQSRVPHAFIGTQQSSQAHESLH